MWRCKKGKLYEKTENFYIGMTTRKFQIIFSEHLGYIKPEKCSELSDIDGLVLEQVRNKNPRAREELTLFLLDVLGYPERCHYHCFYF